MMNKDSDGLVKNKISIITMSFRGGEQLLLLHENIKRLQLDEIALEWIIVDDYSNDAGITENSINNIIATASLDVRAVFLEKNYLGAKSVAAGAAIATGDYTIILDQDDRLLIDSLIVFKKYIDLYSIREDFAGVCGRCVDFNNRLIGRPFRVNCIYANEFEIRYKHKYRGEFFQCTKTQLIRKYFEEMQPGYTNGFIWGLIAQSYRYVYVNEMVRKYNTGNPDSLTSQKKIRYVANIYQETLSHLERAYNYILWDPVSLFRTSLHCIRYHIHAKSKGFPTRKSSKFGLNLLLLLLFPIAYLLVLNDRWKKRLI